MTSRQDSAGVDPVYVRAVLDAYRCTAATTGHVRANDRRLAEELYRRGVLLDTVTDALLLATARRLARPSGAAPLGIVRSLSYFSQVIDELIAAPLTPDYRAYLAAKVVRLRRQSG
jgi:hypothetical protein